MGRISVKDKLPEDSTENVLFIVEVNGFPCVRIGIYDGKGWCLLCGMWNDYRPFAIQKESPVTHWMSLPMPPDGATGNG